MKIALILTGHIRGHEHCYPSIKNNILDKFDTDIFVSSWKGENVGFRTGFTGGDSSEKILNLYEDAKIHLEDHNLYYENRFDDIKFLTRSNDVFLVDERAKSHGRFWVERLRDQWYIVQKGFNLISNPKKYDLIIRLRLDMNLIDLNLYPVNGIVTKYVPNYAPPYILNDWIAFGDPDSMGKYCTLFDNIELLYHKYNIDISFCEYVLGYYLIEHCKIDVKFDEIALSGVLN